MKCKHKGLRALFEEDDARCLPVDLVKRTKHVLALLHASQSPQSIQSRPGFASTRSRAIGRGSGA